VPLYASAWNTLTRILSGFAVVGGGVLLYLQGWRWPAYGLFVGAGLVLLAAVVACWRPLVILYRHQFAIPGALGGGQRVGYAQPVDMRQEAGGMVLHVKQNGQVVEVFVPVNRLRTRDAEQLLERLIAAQQRNGTPSATS
jgi:hypothetical protein